MYPLATAAAAAAVACVAATVRASPFIAEAEASQNSSWTISRVLLWLFIAFLLYLAYKLTCVGVKVAIYVVKWEIRVVASIFSPSGKGKQVIVDEAKLETPTPKLEPVMSDEEKARLAASEGN